MSFGEELRALAKLALPITLVQLGLKTLGVVDNVMIGHAPEAVGGEKAFAAVSLGTFYVFGSSILFTGILQALDPLLSQAYGAKDEPAFARSFQRGLILAALVSIPAMLVLWPAGAFFREAKVKGEDVIAMAESYVHLNIPSLFPWFAFVVLRQTLQSRDIAWPILAVVLFGNVLNALVNWVLIAGHGGFPALGLDGAAWATTLSRWVMMLGILMVGWRWFRGWIRPWQTESAAAAPLANVIRLGMPIGLQFFLEWGVFGAATLAMAQVGHRETGGHQVALDLCSTSFMIPLGIAIAASIRVGQAVGRGDALAVRRTSHCALLCGGGCMATFGVLFIVFPRFFASLYTDKVALVDEATRLVPISGVFQIFDGIQVVSIGCLRGLGDTRTPAIVNVLGFWVLGFPLGLGLMHRTNLGPSGMWWGLTLGLVTVAILLAWRLLLELRKDVRRLSVEG